MQNNIYSKQRMVAHIAMWLLVLIVPFTLPTNNIRLFTKAYLVPWLAGVAISIALFYLFHLFVFAKYLRQGALVKLVVVSILVFVPFIGFELLVNHLTSMVFGLKYNAVNGSAILGKAIVNGFVVALSLFVSLVENWFASQRYMQEVERQRMESELRMLRFQVNPHFLFNTLNNIYTLVYKKSDKAPEAMLKLSSLMRYMLYDATDTFVPLSRELEYLANFVELQKLRLASNQQVSFAVAGNTHSYVIAPLLLVPFIENAFKHGARATEQTEVNIRIAIEGARLTFYCQNSYVSNMESGVNSGIGLENVKRRLELLYNGCSEFRIDKDSGTFTVHLTLNLE